MTWCNPEEARKAIGLKTGDVSDEDISYYIGKAQEDLFDQITVYVFEEPLVGDIDGVNTTFATSTFPIADINFDLVADTLDIEVYKWGEAGSIDLKSTCPLSTIYPNYGTIVLEDAPNSTFDVVTGTYYYFPRRINLDRLREVTALLAGYKYIRSEQLLLPKKWAHGAVRYEKGTPAEDILNEYYRSLDRLVGRRHKKEEHGTITFIRKDVDVK